MSTTRFTTSRWSALLLSAALFSSSLSACGKDAPPPAVDDTMQGSARAPEEKAGMSTGKKVVLLAGAAALYYMYKNHQDKGAAEGPDGQYYLSKNGRVYYRDAEHRAHWVTPPPGGISVPADQAAEYREFEGYNNQKTGRDLTGLAADPE